MIDNESIRALLRSEHDHAISIFLPTHVTGREIRQDPVRFRKLVVEAAERLQHAGMRKPAAEEMLVPAYKLAAHGSATEDDEDLLDYAAGQTILQGGRVELLAKEQLPRNGLMAAILRY
jgi:hypothetical protein